MNRSDFSSLLPMIHRLPAALLALAAFATTAVAAETSAPTTAPRTAAAASGDAMRKPPDTASATADSIIACAVAASRSATWFVSHVWKR